LRKRQIESRRRADTRVGGSAGTGSLRGTGLRIKASKVCSTRPVEYLVGATRRILKLHDIHLLAEALRNSSIGSAGARLVLRGVDSDDAGDAVDMPQRHLQTIKPPQSCPTKIALSILR